MELSKSNAKVYLRIKLNPDEQNKPNQNEMYVLNDSTSLTTKSPIIIGSKTKYSKRRSLLTENPVPKKYNFTKIFQSGCSQEELFEQNISCAVCKFLKLGENSTIITCGTTNSGKTYTMYGTPEALGVVPRAVEMIFSAINCTLIPWYKYVDGKGIVELNEKSCTLEEGRKYSLLNSKSIPHPNDIRKSLENSISDTSGYNDVTEECNLSEYMYSVWLSFVEIYNENVYDLLTEEETRAPLTVTTKKDGTVCLKGVKSLHAKSVVEACQILLAGQSRLNVAETTLNVTSSRSHSIFTITLLKYQKNDAPNEVKVSRLTFCDLAGSGNSRRIQDVGRCLKEAKHINNSLLVLGRCLKVLWNDKHNPEHDLKTTIGLFRESKLTRILQRALSGQEGVIFIVNIDPSSSDLYVDTLSVLNFASTARKIIIDEPSLTNLPSSKTSNISESVCSVLETNRTEIDTSFRDESKENKVREKLIDRVFLVMENFKINWEEQTKEVPSTFFSQMIDYSFKMSNTWCSYTEENDDLKIRMNDLIQAILRRERNIREELISHCSKIFQESERVWQEQVIEESRKLFTTDMDSTDFIRIDNQLKNYEVLKGKIQNLMHQMENLKTQAINRECEIREEMADHYWSLIFNLKNSPKIAIEQNYYDWSKEQILYFHNQRFNDFVSTRKRKRRGSGDNIGEDFETSLIPTEILDLKRTIEQLEDNLSNIDVQKSEYQFELGTLINELNQFYEHLTTSQVDSISRKLNSSDLVTNIKDVVKNKFDSFENDIESIRQERNKCMDEYEKLKKQFDDLHKVVEKDGDQDPTHSNNYDSRNETSLNESLNCSASKSFNSSGTSTNDSGIAMRFSDASTNVNLTKDSYKLKLQRLTEEKIELGTKCDEAELLVEINNRRHKTEINDLKQQLTIKEENAVEMERHLQDCRERSSDLENCLLITKRELENVKTTCSAHYRPKIRKLEEELTNATKMLTEMDSKSPESRKQYERIDQLIEQIDKFDEILENQQFEKDNIVRQLDENLKKQCNLEKELDRCVQKLEEKDKCITTLTTMIKSIHHMNTANREKSKELNRQVLQAFHMIVKMKTELNRLAGLHENVIPKSEENMRNSKSWNTLSRRSIKSTLSFSKFEISIKQLQQDVEENRKAMSNLQKQCVEAFRDLKTPMCLTDKRRKDDDLDTDSWCSFTLDHRMIEQGSIISTDSVENKKDSDLTVSEESYKLGLHSISISTSTEYQDLENLDDEFDIIIDQLSM